MKKLRKQIITIVLVIVLLSGGIVLAAVLNKKNATPVSTVVISLNPEIQCVLNASDNIISVNYLNADAEILLSNQKLEGKDIAQVVKLYTELCIQAGYVDCNSTAEDTGSNIVRYEIVCESPSISERLAGKITQQVNKVFQDKLVYGTTRQITKSTNANLLEKYTAVAQNVKLDLVELDNLSEQEMLYAIRDRSERVQGIRASLLGLLAPENLNSAIKALISQVGNLKELISEIRLELQANSNNPALVQQLNNLELQLNNVEDQLNQKYQEFIDQLKAQSTDYLATCQKLLQDKIDGYSETLNDHNSAVSPNKDVILADIKTFQNAT